MMSLSIARPRYMIADRLERDTACEGSAEREKCSLRCSLHPPDIYVGSEFSGLSARLSLRYGAPDRAVPECLGSKTQVFRFVQGIGPFEGEICHVPSAPI